MLDFILDMRRFAYFLDGSTILYVEWCHDKVYNRCSMSFLDYIVENSEYTRDDLGEAVKNFVGEGIDTWVRGKD